jgi:hypothetical protein
VTEANLKLAVVRSESLMNFYSAERRAGACPLVANERMHEFAKRLDGIQSDFERDLEIIRQVMERTT